MQCTNLCIPLRAKKDGRFARYKIGQRYCSICTIFMETKLNRCPCCKNILRRTNPHQKEKKRIS